MTKIIITESQFNNLTRSLVSEAVGVPEYILESGEKLYQSVSKVLKNINDKETNYEFDIDDVELPISDIIVDNINLSIVVEEIDGYNGPVLIGAMGSGERHHFDEGLMMQVNEKTKTLILSITYLASPEWEPEDLYDVFTKDKIHTTSVLSHELMHKFSHFKKPYELMGGTSDYGAYSSGSMQFGISVINDFMKYSYYIQIAENLVRPTELASRMVQKGITKDQFYDFFNSDEIIVELKNIKNFTYEYLIESLNDQMDQIDDLLMHLDIDITDMSDDEKIKETLRLVYVNLASTKVEIFDRMFYTTQEKIFRELGPLAGLFGRGMEPSEEKENVRNNYINYVIKYQNREIDFFKDECDRFNYVSTKLIKRLSKIYSLLSESKIQEEENCIINWDLYHEMMEKKYGKRKIETNYKYPFKK